MNSLSLCLLMTIIFSAQTFASDESLLQDVAEMSSNLSESVNGQNICADEAIKNSGCEFPVEKINSPLEPVKWGIEGQAAASSAANAVGTILAEIQAQKKLGIMDCQKLLSAAQSAFSKITATTWDDYVMLKFIRENLKELISHPKKFLALGVAAEMSAGLSPKGYDNHISKLENLFKEYSEFNLVAQAIDYKNIFAQLTLDELKQREVSGLYSGIPSLKLETRKEISDKAAKEFAKLFKAEIHMPLSPVIAEKSLQYAKSCDQKLSRVFGNGSNTAVAGSGWEMQGNIKTKLIQGYSQSRRVHLCKSMHVYFHIKKDHKEELFYVPPGCSTTTSGKGKVCRTNIAGQTPFDENGNCREYQESYSIQCKTLGRFKNVNIIASHVSKQGRDIPKTKNEYGSSPIGFLGGAGGDSDDGKVHSHIDMNGGGFRLSFSDAICRTE